MVFHKKGKFTLNPRPKDPCVYDDEFVNFLVSNYKTAAEGGVKFYDLDNEPGIWSQTHPRIHPKPTGYWEMVTLTEKLAFAVTKVDPTAQILGPVSYGWQEFLNLQNSPDSGEINKTEGTFLDFYLKQMKALEAHDGRRLLHILDLHWYPEAQGGGNPSTVSTGSPQAGLGAKRITEGDTSPESVEARLQAPRSLWDPGYVEKSWITQSSTQGKSIQLIPWLKGKIDQDYPGTGLGFSEYDYGAGDHISGGIAQADALGIFGKYGVSLAAQWGKLKPYNLAAFRLYRDYDGKGSAFGDTEVSSGSDDITQTSIYASTDSKPNGVLWVVVLNKNQRESLTGKFEIQGKESYKNWQRYGFNPAVGRNQADGLGRPEPKQVRLFPAAPHRQPFRVPVIPHQTQIKLNRFFGSVLLGVEALEKPRSEGLLIGPLGRGDLRRRFPRGNRHVDEVPVSQVPQDTKGRDLVADALELDRQAGLDLELVADQQGQFLVHQDLVLGADGTKAGGKVDRIADQGEFHAVAGTQVPHDGVPRHDADAHADLDVAGLEVVVGPGHGQEALVHLEGRSDHPLGLRLLVLGACA